MLHSLLNMIFGEDVLVEVQQGWLPGKLVGAVTGDYFYSFKGIPYAKPPIGSLRFKVNKTYNLKNII